MLREEPAGREKAAGQRRSLAAKNKSLNRQMIVGLSGSGSGGRLGCSMSMVIKYVFLMSSQHILTLLEPVSADRTLPRFLS